MSNKSSKISKNIISEKLNNYRTRSRRCTVKDAVSPSQLRHRLEVLKQENELKDTLSRHRLKNSPIYLRKSTGMQEFSKSLHSPMERCKKLSWNQSVNKSYCKEKLESQFSFRKSFSTPASPSDKHFHKRSILSNIKKYSQSLDNSPRYSRNSFSFPKRFDSREFVFLLLNKFIKFRNRQFNDRIFPKTSTPAELDEFFLDETSNIFESKSDPTQLPNTHVEDMCSNNSILPDESNLDNIMLFESFVSPKSNNQISQEINENVEERITKFEYSNKILRKTTNTYGKKIRKTSKAEALFDEFLKQL